MTNIKTYSELRRLKTFEERYLYLKLNGQVGVQTFGADRYLNQIFYTSDEWLRLRDEVILRDNGCDLGMKGYDIYGQILIHHMNAVTVEDVLNRTEYLLNPEYLITTRLSTHNGLHYGKDLIVPNAIIERRKNDTCPWRHKRKEL